MEVRSFMVFLTLNFIFTSVLFSDILYKDIQEVLKTNPIVKERLKNFQASQQDLNIANSQYYPTLDLRLITSYNRAGDDNQAILHHDIAKSQYETYESSLTFTQNLFNGFSTKNKVDYQKSKSLVAAYKYIEKANEMAFRMTEVYIKVLKTQALLDTARQNVQINQSIYSRVKELSDAGLTATSEVKKIHSSLSLARSKLTVANNSASEAQYNYRRILGRMPEVNTMQIPDFKMQIPATIEETALFAIKHNPSLLVGQYNIKSAEALYRQNHKGYYPKLDFEVSKTYNDVFPNDNGFTAPDDRLTARLVLTYNLFHGGLDKANIQKNKSKINQEIDLKQDIKRKVVEDLDIAWTFYNMTVKQLKQLKDYSSYAEETMVLYKEEYNLGRRTLLDLLTAQNDVINSREQIIRTQYNKLLAKYRILDAMGLLISTVIGSANDYTSKVNLVSNTYNAKKVLNIDSDYDHDNVVNDLDLCDNSKKDAKVKVWGCKPVVLDEDRDGVSDAKDRCPSTSVGVEVSADGCEYDSDGDGVVNSKDECPETASDKNVSINGCVIDLYDTRDIVFNIDKEEEETFLPPLAKDSLMVFYKKNSFNVSDNSREKINQFTRFLKDNKRYDVILIGHAYHEGNKLNMQHLSEKRAKDVALMLIKNGIDKIRLSYDGVGDSEPIAFSRNDDKETSLNRRVKATLIDVNSGNVKEVTQINNNNVTDNKRLVEEEIVPYTLDIKFAQNSFKLPKTSNKEMKKLASFLKENSAYHVEVIGHTSNIGEASANKWLSKTRAKYVTLDLIKRGISKKRLTYKGVGDTEPIAFGTSEKDLALNRRIEIKLIKIK